MNRVAVFVDAGYLFAQGTTALTGAKKERHFTDLKSEKLLRALRSVVNERSGHGDLLRVYWYDAIPKSGLTSQQQGIAAADHIKLRLGLINEYGRQKGVDSLIVTDLVELSRNKAISDAVLLSGDEDMRIGVEIAQSLGVRVHLLGIAPARGSQSWKLRLEADTNTEWNRETVAEFLEVHAPLVPNRSNSSTKQTAGPVSPVIESGLREVVQAFLGDLTDGETAEFLDTSLPDGFLPKSHDGRLLAICREKIGRDLTDPERLWLRRLVRTTVAGKNPGSDPAPMVPTIAAPGPTVIEETVTDFSGDLSETEKERLLDGWRQSPAVPPEYDGRLLAECRTRLGRDLTPKERRELRQMFKEQIGRRAVAT